MYGINKAPETMSSKERVQRTFCFEKTDRVPIGYDSNAGIHNRLCGRLGVNPNDQEALFDALGVDYYRMMPCYTGPELFTAPPGKNVNPLTGCIMRWVDHPTGGYWDYCDFPLQDGEEEDFANFPIPNPDHFDYASIEEAAKHFGKKYALYVGSNGAVDIINSNGMLTGMEDILCHLLDGEDYVMDFIRRRVDFELGMLERTICAAKGNIDFLWFGDDLGTQIGPMISMELYRERLKPFHKLVVDLADAYHIPTMMHSCGSSSWVFEDLIDIGVRCVEALQPEAANMSPAYLAEMYGGRLNFRGAISTGGPLAYGTVKETREVCRQTLETFMEKRGYHFAPSHCIQDNTPVENVIAMYQASHDFGRY